MGTTNRQFRSQVKMKYVRPVSFKTTKKEQVILDNSRSSIDERNDAIDAYTYASSTLASSATSEGSIGYVYTVSSSTGFYGRTIEGRRPSTEEQLEAEQKTNAELHDQLIKYRRAKEVFIQVLTNVHVMLQELDLSDLRMTEPFQYRVKRNELDEIFNNVLKYMEQCDGTALGNMLNEKMIRYFEERGLL